MKKNISFSCDDVIAVSQALIDSAVQWDSSDYDRDHYFCVFCGVKLYDHEVTKDPTKKLIHRIPCPVLVAQDLLTGLESKKEGSQT